MKARGPILAFIALLLLAAAFLGCDGFFVDQNTTTSFPVYAANSGAGSISAFRLNPDNGALTSVSGSPFGSGQGPNQLGTNSSGTFLYSANLGGGISAWTVNADGTLTALSGSPFQSGTQFTSLAVDPTLRFVFGGVNGASNIQGFTAVSTGVLTPIAGLTVTAGTPRRMREAASGKVLFVAEGNAGVDVFTIATDGSLTLSQNVPLTAANDIAISPNVKFAYVAEGSGVSGYTVDATTGNLTAVAGSPFAAGTNPSGVAVDPSGKFVFVTNAGSNNVSAYTLDSTTGVLTEVSGSPFSSGTGPSAVTVDPSSRYVYVANKTAGSLSLFTIDTTTAGKLNANGSTSTGVGPNDVIVVP